MQKPDYYYQKKREYKDKLEELKQKLPGYVQPYLNDKELTIQISSVTAYAYDLVVFFEYLVQENPLCKGLSTHEVPLEVIAALDYNDINEYQRFLKQSSFHESSEKGIARRMAPLRGFYQYQCIHGELQKDPTIGASKQKLKKRDDIVYMDQREVNSFLNTVQYTNIRSERQRKFCEKAQYRDTALCTLMLKTGIRVSECVGIDLDDLNFTSKCVRIVRKGGFSKVVYFDDMTATALKEYIEYERNPMLPTDSDEPALFLSNRKTRIGVRAVENIIKKFAEESVPGKHITPHKLRSSFGSALYEQTGDIYLVATALDHQDINTSARHYAAQTDKKKIANINLYEDSDKT